MGNTKMAKTPENFWTAKDMNINYAAWRAARVSDFGVRLRKIRDEIELDERSVVDASERVGCTWCGGLIDKKDIKWTTADNGRQYIDECPHCHYDDFISDAGGRFVFTADELHRFSHAGRDELTRDETWLIENGLGGYLMDADADAIYPPLQDADIADFVQWMEQNPERIKAIAGETIGKFKNLDIGWCNERTIILAKFQRKYPDGEQSFHFVPVPQRMLREYMAEHNDTKK